MKKPSELSIRIDAAGRFSAKENTALAMLAAAGPKNAKASGVRKLVKSLDGDAHKVAIAVLDRDPVVAKVMDVGVSAGHGAGVTLKKNVENATRLRTWGSGEENLFVERRADGEYVVMKPGAVRASAIAPTQAEAIKIARRISSESGTLVERVRVSSAGKSDKWRKR